MELRAFGSAGLRVPVLGQGTWAMELDGRREAVAALRAGMDAGMIHIDTAEMYGSGEAERIVAEAIEGRRDQVFLVSKVLPSNATRQGTVRACEASLRRLGTDRLDGYLLHWRGDVPLAETVAAFDALLQAGKIRSWGVSNFDVADLDEALALAGPGRIACNQVLYHLGERAIEHAVVPWCERNGVTVVAYSPFGSGEFPSPTSPGGRELARIGRALGASARQVALAFLTRRGCVVAIPKASRVSHVVDNAGAARVHLSTADIEALDAAFPPGERRALPML